MALNEKWTRSTRRIERLLRDLYENCSEPQTVLFESMRYSLLAGGKRLRPFLVYLFCQACGGTPEAADNAALAVEMIHTYSLIHDDLPCMDNDDYRRGKLTNHKVFGEANAVLSGDALLTDAFRVLSSGPIPPNRLCECVRILSECAGPCGMVGGQVLDMLSEQRVCNEREVLDIQTRKTGALIRAACQLGVVCGGGSKEHLAAAHDYAEALGLAFQIRDDVLDVIGSQELLGKAVGADKNKNTFVRLYGIDRCSRMIRDLTDKAISSLSVFDDAADLSAVAEALANRDF